MADSEFVSKTAEKVVDFVRRLSRPGTSTNAEGNIEKGKDSICINITSALPMGFPA